MEKDYFKELYEAKKELARCYAWMLKAVEAMECLPLQDNTKLWIVKSKADILDDIDVMKRDLDEEI